MFDKKYYYTDSTLIDSVSMQGAMDLAEAELTNALKSKVIISQNEIIFKVPYLDPEIKSPGKRYEYNKPRIYFNYFFTPNWKIPRTINEVKLEFANHNDKVKIQYTFEYSINFFRIFDFFRVGLIAWGVLAFGSLPVQVMYDFLPEHFITHYLPVVVVAGLLFFNPMALYSGDFAMSVRRFYEENNRDSGLLESRAKAGISDKEKWISAVWLIFFLIFGYIMWFFSSMI